MNRRLVGPCLIKKRSIVLSGRKTSIGIEEAFWRPVKASAAHEGISVAQLIARIDAKRWHANVSSSIRLHVLDYYRKQQAAIRSKRSGDARPSRACCRASSACQEGAFSSVPLIRPGFGRRRD
jgi:predicted DNA-binding ribbon-helix-helix protein